VQVKKRRPAGFFSKPFLRATGHTLRGTDSSLRFRSVNRTGVGIAAATIRSVSHMGLASFLVAASTGQNYEPKGAWQKPWLPPVRFSWSTVLLPHAPAFGQRARASTRRPSRLRRDQKTFSAGPRSFTVSELWFPGSGTLTGVQPLVDSRHGRIADKVSVSCVNIELHESGRLQSHLRAPGPTPKLAGSRSQNQLAWPAGAPNMRLGS